MPAAADGDDLTTSGGSVYGSPLPELYCRVSSSGGRGSCSSSGGRGSGSRTSGGGDSGEPFARAAGLLSRARIERMGRAYEHVRRRVQNAWHEQAWRGSTNDPHRLEHQSTEFGWSTMPGGAPKQKAARAAGRVSTRGLQPWRPRSVLTCLIFGPMCGQPWRLNAWENGTHTSFRTDDEQAQHSLICG